MSGYVNINRLEFLITYECTSQCIHCYNTGTGINYPKHIDKNLAIEIVAKIGNKYDLKSVMTFGGEPLLYPDIVGAIHEKAANIGIEKRQVITNGYWSQEKNKVRRIAKMLASSGVNHVAISVDAFHQAGIPLDEIRYSTEALIAYGITNIKWNPCWLVSSEAENQYNSITRAILKELEDLSIPISEGNVVQPDGRAVTNLSEYFERKKSFPGVSCQDIPYMNRLDNIQSICVEPNGDIFLCQGFTLGNAQRNDIIEIIESYDPCSIPEVKVILDKGVQGLVDDRIERGIQLDGKGYYTICDLCMAVRNNSTHN